MDAGSVTVGLDVNLDTGGVAEFIRDVEAGAEKAMQEMSEIGRDIALTLAPAPSGKIDPRTVSIQGGMFAEHDATSATWGSTARHTLAQEFGGARHPQTGQATFFWEHAPEGPRPWVPGPNQINHPGNPAHPFLRPSFEAVWQGIDEYLRKNIES